MVIRNGTDVSYDNGLGDGYTHLHHISDVEGNEKFLSQAMRALLAGARRQKKELIDKQDKWGETALHYAVQNNQGRFVRCLLINGANWKLTNVRGQTPLDLARTLERKELIKVFKNLEKLTKPEKRKLSSQINTILPIAKRRKLNHS